MRDAKMDLINYLSIAKYSLQEKLVKEAGVVYLEKQGMTFHDNGFIPMPIVNGLTPEEDAEFRERGLEPLKKEIEFLDQRITKLAQELIEENDVNTA